MKNWYSVKNKANGVLNISIHDEIGAWGITAADFIAELDKHQDAQAINLSIHSPGGNVFDGLAIYNKLRSHKATIYGTVEGIAASAASFVLLASDYRSMPENAWIMVHNEFSGAMGSGEDLIEAGEFLLRIRQQIVNIYTKHTNIGEEEALAMMSEETWMDGKQALSHGFIDTLTDSVDVAANSTRFDKYFKDLPVSATQNLDEINSIKEFERHLREVHGVSKRLATALTSRMKEVLQGELADETDDSAAILAALERFKTPEKLIN